MKECVVGGCSNSSIVGQTKEDTVSLHKLPNPKTDARRWSNWVGFINIGRKDFRPSAHSVVCSAHFTDSDYSNIDEYNFKRSNGWSSM